VYAVNAGGSDARNRTGSMSVQVASPKAHAGGISASGTMRNGGANMSGSLASDDAVVTFHGVQAPVGDFIKMGVLVRRADGTVAPAEEATGEAEEPAQEQQQQQDSEEPLEALSDRAADEAFSTLCNNASIGNLTAAMGDVVKGQPVSDVTLNRIASEMGLEPEQARAMEAQVRAGFEADARRAVEALGLPSDKVFAWAYRNEPKLMADAIRRNVNDRTTKGYAEVAKAYLSNLAEIDPEAILEAPFGDGITVYRSDNGEIVVRDVEKGEARWRTAVREGWISLT
jgi:hypothetical protein